MNRYLRLNSHGAILRAQNPPPNPVVPPHENCELIPLSASQRAAVGRVVARVDYSHRGFSLRDVLRRHRIQIGALVTVNLELTQLALDVANTANATPADTDAPRRFLETVSLYGNSDLRADLQPVVSALQAL